MAALKGILASHNLSETSEAAMKYAMALARTFGEKLHRFHVSRTRQTDIATEDLLGIDPSIEDAGGAPRARNVGPADRKVRTMPRQSTLDGFADEPSPCEGVSLLDLEPFTALLVRTCHSVYRIIVLQDTTVLVKGGPYFPDVTIGQLNGSRFSGNLLKLGWIGVGLRMDISSDGKRFITSAVRAIEPESNPSMYRPQ
jgi:hypothetical protein